jgi:hypothetical protein
MGAVRVAGMAFHFGGFRKNAKLELLTAAARCVRSNAVLQTRRPVQLAMIREKLWSAKFSFPKSKV